MEPDSLCASYFYCQHLISLKSYQWGIHVFSQKGFALLLPGFGGTASLKHLKLRVHGSPEWRELWLWMPRVSVLLPYCPDPLGALATFPAVLVWVCRLSSRSSLCWVFWDSNVMWNGPKMDIWNITDLEARMRRSNISSVFQKRSWGKVR